MKKVGLMLSFIAIFLFLSFQLKAQDKEKNVGIGVSLSKVAGWLSDYLTFYMPINTSSKFRLEPEIGFNLASDSLGIWNRTNLTVSVGCGFFALKHKEKANIYYGARFGCLLISYRTNGRSSRTDFFFGPALGGEYLFSKNFSLGGEVQLIYNMIGVGEGGESASELKTKPLFFVRWYF